MPSGYVQTGGGPNGDAGDAYYTINAAAGHNYSGNNFDDYLIPSGCCPRSPSRSAPAPRPRWWATWAATRPREYGLRHAAVGLRARCTRWWSTRRRPRTSATPTPTNRRSTRCRPAAIPPQRTIRSRSRSRTTYYQIDFVCGTGDRPARAEPEQRRYGPDSAEILYHAQSRLITSDNGGCTAPNPMPTGHPATPPNPVTVPTSASTLDRHGDALGRLPPRRHDHLLPLRARRHAQRIVQQQRLQRHRRPSTATARTPRPRAPTQAAMSRRPRAPISGSRSTAATRITTASPTPSGRARVRQRKQPVPEHHARRGSDDRRHGQAHRLGDALGRLQPDRDDHLLPLRSGRHAEWHVQQQRLQRRRHGQRRRGLYHGLGRQPGRRLAHDDRTFQWVAVYSGDPATPGPPARSAPSPRRSARPARSRRADSAASASGRTRTARPPSRVSTGAPRPPQLGTWLASNFPNLFGCKNPYTSGTLAGCGSTSLAGLTDAQVAAVYNSLWNPSGTTKNTYVQAFSAALGIYADTAPSAGTRRPRGSASL